MKLEGINVQRTAKTFTVQRTGHPVVFHGQAQQAIEWFFAAALVRKIIEPDKA